jgi:hypothetical protein
MADQEMIDRVAKAIRLRDTTDEFAMARAAIAAMREPTEKMIDTGNTVTDWADGADEAWRLMIDCILND